MLNALAILAIAFTLSGCDQSLVSAMNDRQIIVYGRASAGPIRSALVTVYQLLPDGTRGLVLQTTATDSHGAYSASIGKYSGPIEVTVTHGYYYEESSGTLVALTTEEIRSRLSSVTSANDVAITPLTEIAVSRADQLFFQGADLLSAIDRANLATAQAAGLDNILSSPADPWVTQASPQSHASKYAILLAGLSQMAEDGGSNSIELGMALANDFTDGKFDGLTVGNNVVQVNSGPNLPAGAWASLSTSMLKYVNSSANTSGFSAVSVTQLNSAPESKDR